MDTNPKHAWFKITKGAIIFIFIYYILLLTISASILFTQLSVKLNSPEVITFTNTIFCSIFLSIIGAATFYIRKLYKACINLDVNQPKEESDKIRQIGVIFYFLLRPVFAIVFSILIIIATKSGVGLLSEGNLNSVRFFYYCLLISFFTGYSCGRFLDNMEKIKDKIAEKLTDIKF